MKQTIATNNQRYGFTVHRHKDNCIIKYHPKNVNKKMSKFKEGFNLVFCFRLIRGPTKERPMLKNFEIVDRFGSVT